MIKRVIILSLDALRWDALGCVSDRSFWAAHGLADRVATPTLDAIAAAGVRCAQAVTTATYTSSAHASLLSGLLPSRHGCQGAFYQPLSEAVSTLPAVLKRHGFNTVFGSDMRYVFDLLGLTRGFDHRFCRNDEALLEALAPYRGGRLFLLAHFMDTTNPYGYSDEPAMAEGNAEYFRTLRRLVDRYLGGREVPGDRPDKYYTWCTIKQRMAAAGEREEIVRLYLDGVVRCDGGRLKWFLERLEGLGLLEDALVVALGDHGEGQYADRFDHSLGAIEDVIRVPLLMAAPGLLPAGSVVEEPVSLVDLVPTVLDLLGLGAEPELWPAGLDGESLLPAIRGETAGAAARATVTEVWRHLDGVVPYRERCKAKGILEPPDYSCFLWQRAVRTPEAKYVLLGEQVPPDDAPARPASRDIYALPDEPGQLSGELLFDLSADPLNRRDLVQAYPDAIPPPVLESCRRLIRQASSARAIHPGAAIRPRPLRVNLGCGDDRRGGYLNVDEYAAGADQRMDIRALSFPDGSVDEIFSAHALEHLGKHEVPPVLRELRRVLRPRGRLVLNLPNLEWCVRHWLSLPESERWGWPLDTLFGLQTHPGEFHKTGFTGARVRALLEEADFSLIQVLPYWSHGQECLWVEACAGNGAERDQAGRAESGRLRLLDTAPRGVTCRG
jgi:arylsulfatase A-like enzyme/predicted SAM-dependent methyltransferase